MSQFDEIVKNIALENKKCNYDPEKKMSWYFLSWKKQNKCLERMDFETRIRLSQTSKYEKHRFSEEHRKLEYIAERVALETGKSNYNPKIDLNWCNMPMEMRNECLKRMDFKTRTRLSATSKTEKSLVQAKKFQFHRLHIDLDSQTLEWNVTAATKIGNREQKTVVETYRTPDYRFISAILKHGEVKNFRFFGWLEYCRVPDVRAHLEKFAPFRFERVSVFCVPYMDFFVKNCVNAKKIDHGGERVYFPFKEMLDLPSITNINEFRLSEVYPPDITGFLDGLVPKWIDNDVETGKSVQCIMELPWNVQRDTQEFVDNYTEKFADRIIEKTNKEIRIRMNNEKKQILLRLIDPPNEIRWTPRSPANLTGTYLYFSCKVVRIDLPKSEYGKGDEWLQTILERKEKLANAEDQKVWDHLWF